MDQITGALVAIALVLAAVFVPMAFFGGSIGVIYRQFSITLVSAMGLSVLVALILTPALCATILKPLPPSGHVEHTRLLQLVQHARSSAAAPGTSAASIAHAGAPGRSMLVYLGIVVRRWACCSRASRSSFLPDEDPGFMYGQVQTPPGASQGAHLGRARRGAEVPARTGEGHRRRRAHRERLQLRRHGPELRPAVHQAARLGRAQEARRSRCRRCSAAPTNISPASRTPTSSRCRRRPCSSSATPPAST